MGRHLRARCSPRPSSAIFTPEQLDALYGDEAGYLARFEEAAQRAVDAGDLFPRDAAPAVAEAAAEYRRARAATTVVPPA